MQILLESRPTESENREKRHWLKRKLVPSENAGIRKMLTCQPVLEVWVSLERVRGQVRQQARPVKTSRRRLLLAVLKGL